MRFKSQSAFTLIELSIVLVIIGLIVGGVLVGKDLIEAAQLRSQISQIGQFNTAVKSFQLKYNCLPGDCTKATNFGLGVNGDGDGIMLQGNSTNMQFAQFQGESYNFWYHLYSAGLTEFQGVSSLPAGYYTEVQYKQSQPAGKLPNSYIVSSSFNNPYAYTGWGTDINGYFISSTQLGPNGQPYFKSLLMPLQASRIDEKLDDGQPFAGKIVAAPSWILIAFCTQPNCYYLDSQCTSSATSYNVSYQTAGCNLAFKSQY